MEITELQELLKTQNFGYIKKVLKRKGFVRADKDKELCHVSIMNVLHSDEEEAEDVETPKYCYCGTIYKNAKNCEGIIWVWVEVLKAYGETYNPYKLVVFAKK